jgi:prefoldin subunit 5
VLRDLALAPFDRSAIRRATLLVPLLLAVIPTAAEARTFKIDGRVSGTPTASRGAVTVPFELTRRAGRALDLGTRRVIVRLRTRARLRLTGPGASGASRLSPRGLRAGDRVTGVTSLSRRARRRMRWHARPELKLQRARVIRPAAPVAAPPRALGRPGSGPAGGGPAPPGGGPAPLGPSAAALAQTVAHLQAETAALSARAAELGSLSQKIDAGRPRLESFKLAVEGAMTAFDSLKTALEDLEGSVDQATLDTLLDRVAALRLRVEALKNGIGSIDSMLGELEGAVSKVRSAAEKLVPTVGSLPGQVLSLAQTAGAPELVSALDAGTTILNGRLATAESGLDSLAGATESLIVALASLQTDIEALAGAAQPGTDLATVGAGVDGLGATITSLENGFGGLLATTNALVPAAEAIETEAPGLETTVGQLCSLVPTTCP